MRRALLWTFLLVVGCAGAGVELRQEGQLVQVRIDGQPFATVHIAAEPRPFVFPVHGPGGVSMTRSFPMQEVDGEQRDHPHHQSLWFAHGDVNGFDFWHGTKRRERIVLDGAAVVDGVHVRCRYRWLVDDDTLVATEERVLTFGGTVELRTIDVHVTLRAGASPLVLGDTKEGTFAMRVHEALRVDGKLATGVLQNSEGARGAEVWGKRARWIDDSGTVDGRSVGVAMFDHAQNPRHPTWWHARTYGLLAANAFGVHDFEKKPAGAGAMTVPVGGDVQFRYRVLLHGGGMDATRIEAAYRQWLGG